jgi:crotonobetainyl-CoA:carnitine CoA-transferase CaiB-like acyl-CoA transferase
MEWTVIQDQYDVLYCLQKAGVAAGAVLRVEQVHDNPRLGERGFYEKASNPDTITHLYRNVGYRMSKTPRHVLRHPPYLGEHNEYVLGTILACPRRRSRYLRQTR